MNPAVQKYAPPAVVLGAALYLGWSPSAPLDLGDGLVKAKAVRWKSDDLEPPPPPGAIIDPFRPVLIVKADPKPVEQDLVAVPAGPTVDDIRGVVKLSGVAKSGGQSWAILNGRARLAGDSFKVEGKSVNECKLIAILADHVVVQSEQTIAVIRPQVSSNSPKTTTIPPAATIKATEVMNPAAAAPTPDVGPPPQA